MQKKVLSEKALYQGKVLMPKGFEIDPFILSNQFLKALIWVKILFLLQTGLD